MCYHTSTPSKKDLKKILDQEIRIGDYEPHYHVSGFEHPELPIMMQKEPGNVQPAVWGFIPVWAKAEESAALMNKTLNARAETIFTTPMYRGAAPGHRCLVFVDGFFEWKHETVNGKLQKVPFYIQMPDYKPFAFAGLYSHWIDKSSGGGEMLTTCNIITTEANQLMATIHNSKKRMPLILTEDEWNIWLDPKASEADVKEVMRPFREDILDAHEISKDINAKGVNTDVPEIQEAVRLIGNGNNQLF